MSYAQGTTVSVEKSRFEIEQLMKKAGATAFGFFDDDADESSMLVCMLDGYRLVFRVKKPPVSMFEEREFRGATRKCPPDTIKKLQKQEEMRRWRAQLLIIKAKLEMIEQGASTVAQEFLGNVALPDGRVASDVLVPMLQAARDGGKLPRLLLPGL